MSRPSVELLYETIPLFRGGRDRHTTGNLKRLWIVVNIVKPLTQVSTEGHVSSISWYYTAVGTSWTQGSGIVKEREPFLTSQFNELNISC